jgi:hypothetical protein
LKTSPVSQQSRKRGNNQHQGPDLQDLLECLRSLKRVRWKVRRRTPQRDVGILAQRPEPAAEPNADADEVTPDQSPERSE